MLLNENGRYKDTQKGVKNLTKSNSLYFAFGGENKVYTRPNEATDNVRISLNQLVDYIKSDAPRDALEVRKICKNGFENNLPSKEVKQQIRPYKNNLPFVLLSGFCPKHHNNQDLQYNGCFQIDIDFKFSGGDLKASVLKTKVQTLPFVIFAAISPSGYGLKLLIATDNDNKQEHSKISSFIIQDLSEQLEVDEKYFDNLGASQPCFIPFDKEVYYNSGFSQYNVFKALYKHEQRKRKELEIKLSERLKTAQYSSFANYSNIENSIPNIEIVKYLAKQLQSFNIDITADYDEWFKVACSVASCGENARSLFHQIAALNSEYDFNENEKKFDEGLKANWSSIGYLVNRCKDFNITTNDFCRDWIIENAPKNNLYRVFSDVKDYKDEARTHYFQLDENQYIGNVLNEKFTNGLYLIKAGTGTGKTWFVANNFQKVIVISRNVTTLENYSKYGFTQFIFSDNKDGFSELQANGKNKITVTYKSFQKLRETVNLDNYKLVFDEAHLLNESFHDVRSETRYCYNSINDLALSNTVILMSANEIHYNGRDVEYKGKYYFKKPSVVRDCSVKYNGSFFDLKQAIEKRLKANKQVLLFTNRTETKYISQAINEAFQDNTTFFFDGSKHGRIDLENLQHDITITTSALVTGKDVLNENLAVVFYGLDRQISSSTIVQFFGRARKFLTATFDLIFTFKNDNEKYGSYSYSNLVSGAHTIASATIGASVNDISFLRENKERFVSKTKDGQLIVDWFTIDNHIQQTISKHTILNTDVLSKFLEQHGYQPTIDILTDTEQEKEQKSETYSISEMYDLELNEIGEGNADTTEFLTNAYNRFSALLKVGFDKETAIGICTAYKSKMRFTRFVDLIVVEQSLKTNDKVFIKVYNDILNAIIDFVTTQQLIEQLSKIPISKAGRKTKLGQLIIRAKKCDVNDTKNTRSILKNLRSFYDVEQQKAHNQKTYKLERSDYLQGLSIISSDIEKLFSVLDIGYSK